MTHNSQVEIPQSQVNSATAELEAIAQRLHQIALEREGDGLGLLEILRMLERVHREISDGIFQASLPTNRQALYAFLRDIETSGGWPYIYSRKLRVVLSELVTTLMSQTDQPGGKSIGLPDPTSQNDEGDDPESTV